MKSFLFLSSLLLISFLPILSHAFLEEVSFERICREATIGDDYNLCVSALQGIPVDKNANIQELAMIAVEQLIANCSHDIHSLKYGIGGDVSPEFNFGNIFKCVSKIAEVIKDIKDAIAKIQSGDIAGAIGELKDAVEAVVGCLGDSSSGGADGLLPKELASILKIAKIAIDIVSWLTKMS